MSNRKLAQQKPPPGIVWIEDYVDKNTGEVILGIASRVGVTPSTYRKWRMQAKGPESFLLGKRVAARIASIDAWIAQQGQATQRDAQPEVKPAEPRLPRRTRKPTPALAA
jgi:transposase-like protein